MIINIRKASLIESQLIQIQLQFVLDILLQSLVPHALTLVGLGDVRVERALALLFLFRARVHEVVGAELEVHEVLVFFLDHRIFVLFVALFSPVFLLFALFLEIRVLLALYCFVFRHDLVHQYL